MMYKVITDRDPLNYRSGPGKHFEKIGELPRGAYVKGSEDSPGWVRTELDGREAWLSLDFLCPTAGNDWLVGFTREDLLDLIAHLEAIVHG